MTGRRTGHDRTLALQMGLFRQKFPFVSGSLSVSMALRGVQNLSSESCDYLSRQLI